MDSEWAGAAMRHLGYDAHHIVPWDFERAKHVRKFMLDNGFTMDEIKFGKFNGVWLPGSARTGKGVKGNGIRSLWPKETWHKGSGKLTSKHSKTTMQAIQNRLEPLQGNKQAIKDEIIAIGREMQQGVFKNA